LFLLQIHKSYIQDTVNEFINHALGVQSEHTSFRQVSGRLLTCSNFNLIAGSIRDVDVENVDDSLMQILLFILLLSGEVDALGLSSSTC